MGQSPDDGSRDPETAWQSPSGDSPPDQPQYGQPQYPPPPGYHDAPPPGYGVPPAYSPPQGYSPPGYAVPGYGPPIADKPGVIPLRPLAVGELLDGAFSTIRINPKAMLGLSFVIVLVGQIIVLALNLSAHDASSGARFSLALGGLVITQLVTTVTTGAVIIVIGEAVLGSRITPAETLARLRGRVWPLVGLGLLVSLLTLLGTVLLLIPGIYVAVLLSLATPAFILEKSTVGTALSRSAELVRGAWWRTFGILILAYLVGTLISGLIQIPFTLFATHSSSFLTTSSADISTGSQVLLSLGRLLGGTLTTPIIAGTIALMYIDRRMRREGLDLVLAQTARERQGRS